MQNGPNKVKFSEKESFQFETILRLSSYNAKRVAISKLTSHEQARYQLYFALHRPQYNESYPSMAPLSLFRLSHEERRNASSAAASSTVRTDQDTSLSSSISSSAGSDEDSSENSRQFNRNMLRKSI